VALPASDPFNDAGLSASWTQQQATTVKEDGAGLAFINSGATDDTAFWNADAFNNNQYGEVILDTFAGGIARACVRCAGTTAATKDYYAATTDGDIIMCLNGTLSTLFNGATTFAAGDTLRCEVVGTAITMFKNGASVGTATDSTLASGSAGFGGDGDGSGVFFRSWAGGNLASASLPRGPRTFSFQQRAA